MITVSETQCSSNIRGARGHPKVISLEELRMVEPGSSLTGCIPKEKKLKIKQRNLFFSLISLRLFLFN